MKIEQIYTGCLAQGAYYISSNGEAAIIDPLREVGPYLDKAKRDGDTIKYVFETHFHADFVSGHLDLAAKTGASIVYGPNASTGFISHIAKDGEVFKLGDIEIIALHTPGHTMESTTYLLRDEQGKEHAIFSGDTLFIGDVGRPDLAQKSGELTTEDLAGHLFDSLRNKIMTLPDEVIVYPAHGAGSACGKNMSSETTDTLGNQKKFNYALRHDMNKEEFIKEVTSGLLPPPGYFPENVRMNKSGYASLDQVIAQGAKALSPAAFEAAANETEALLLDTREPATFSKGFIPGSINIGIDGSFAPWVGALIPSVSQPLLLIAEEGRVEEVITRLARVGYDNPIGYLKGGFEAWQSAGRDIDQIASIEAEDFIKLYESGKELKLADVRKPGEYCQGHLANAESTPLDYINEHMSTFSQDSNQYLYCAGGYRSMIAASILKSRGISQPVNINGGYEALLKANLAEKHIEAKPQNA